MLQNLAVGLIVALAALHAAARYLPAGWRRKLVYLLAARGASQATMAGWLRTEASCGGGCDSCKACAAPAEAAASAAGKHRVIRLTVRK